MKGFIRGALCLLAMLALAWLLAEVLGTWE